MSSRRISSFVDALLTDRRPRRFKGGPTDASLLRVAIAIRACSPKERSPDDTFIEYLRKELDVQAHGTDRSRARLAVRGRTRLVVGAVAAFSTLGGATVVATTSVEHALAAAPAAQVTYSHPLRMGTFESKDGKTVGEIVAYRGNPSWVFMSIESPGLTGTLRCQIEMDNGHIQAVGSFVVQNGIGYWARPIPVDTGQIRGATLVTSTGSALATASFSES